MASYLSNLIIKNSISYFVIRLDFHLKLDGNCDVEGGVVALSPDDGDENICWLIIFGQLVYFGANINLNVVLKIFRLFILSIFSWNDTLSMQCIHAIIFINNGKPIPSKLQLKGVSGAKAGNILGRNFQ